MRQGGGMRRLYLRVGELMEEQGISEAEMSRRADVSRNAVRSLMRGVNTRIDFDVIEKIAAVLNVSPKELFADRVESGNRKPALISA